MDSTACNYNIDATQDDTVCTYPETNYDCENNCIATVDACGTCGGTVENTPDCCPEGQVPDCTGACGGSTVADCNGDCGGSSVEDTCGICDGDGSTCNISYSITIQPIFTDRCISCHNGSHSTGLDLRSYTGVTSGSTNNQVIISGSQETSLLWQYVNSGYMPPSPNDLTASQIGLIATWIYEGALNN